MAVKVACRPRRWMMGRNAESHRTRPIPAGKASCPPGTGVPGTPSPRAFRTPSRRYACATFCHISEKLTAAQLIYGGDDNWLNLCTTRRSTRNFTLTDFEACVRQLWQNDWYDFRCEAYRIGLHQMMLMHIGTSARSAEYVMNLRYRVSLAPLHGRQRFLTIQDTLLYQVWFEDRPQPQLVIDLCRNHTKGLANLPRQQFDCPIVTCQVNC